MKTIDRATRPALDEALLNRMQQVADPLADRTVAAIFDSPDHELAAFGLDPLAADAPLWRRIGVANALISQWQSNGQIANWQPKLSGLPEATVGETETIVRALQTYLLEAHALPEWARADDIALAEQVFIDHGVLSCLLLFCASLPQCYVLPDLSDVLHAAGQLEAHTDHRIRSTAAMIFPVMLKGGLTSPEGSGIAQILKVRLIHAMIRHLVLRRTPEDVIAALGRDEVVIAAPMALESTQRDMYRTLFAHGWDVARDGLPCNQEELAYTLLTFHYVFIQGMRTLAVPLEDREERAYLHTWNVVAHVLGIVPELTQDEVAPARAAFDLMQARGRADADKRVGIKDPRPKLGVALMKSMEDALPLGVLRGVPSLLTRTLCGATVVRELGIENRATLVQRGFYVASFGVARVIDSVARLIWKDFSLAKLMTRVVGYHLLTKLLISQTRPLRLPDRLLDDIESTVNEWSDDKNAPGWLNRVEDRLTTKGQWHLPRNRRKTDFAHRSAQTSQN